MRSSAARETKSRLAGRSAGDKGEESAATHSTVQTAPAAPRRSVHKLGHILRDGEEGWLTQCRLHTDNVHPSSLTIS